MRDLLRLLMGAVILAAALFAGIFLGLIVIGVLVALMVAGVFLRWRLMRRIKAGLRTQQAQAGPSPIEGEYRVIQGEAAEVLPPERIMDSP